MSIRNWTALAVIALAVVAIFFALHGTFSDTENAPGRDASKYTVKQVPSNPDTAPPRQP
jgi:hypothetical protein